MITTARGRLRTRMLTLQTVMIGSLGLFFATILLLSLTLMTIRELAVTVMIGTAALAIFTVATIIQTLHPEIRTLRLRVHQLELHRQVDGLSAEITDLQTAMAEVSHAAPAHVGATSHPEVWVLSDPDEGAPALFHGGVS